MPSLFEMAHANAMEKAVAAGQKYLDDHLNGEDNYPCGFAWVVYRPVNRGNSRAGREERALVRGVGFNIDAWGKTFEMSPYRAVQNINAKEAAAEAYVKAMEASTGMKFSVRSRLD